MPFKEESKGLENGWFVEKDDLSEEKEDSDGGDEESEEVATMEEKLKLREKIVNYSGFGLLIFAVIAAVDLFWFILIFIYKNKNVFLKKTMRVVRIELTTFGLWDQRSSNWAKPALYNCFMCSISTVCILSQRLLFKLWYYD